MKKFYIKERYNPQLGTYYVAMDQMTRKEARECEDTLYGSNTMHGFDNEEDYRRRIAELKAQGERVQ